MNCSDVHVGKVNFECIVMKLKVMVFSLNVFFVWEEWTHFGELEFLHRISVSTNPYASK